MSFPGALTLARALVTLVVVLLLVGATVGLHDATASSSDAWGTSIEAVATVVLVVITAWYAFLTYRLTSLQERAPRAESWEVSLRELSRLIARRHQTLWTAAEFFPVDTAARPPMITDVTDSRDALKELRNDVLELVGLLPRDMAGSALGAAAFIVNAETELHSLAAALDENTRRPGRETKLDVEGCSRGAHGCGRP